MSRESFPEAASFALAEEVEHCRETEILAGFPYIVEVVVNLVKPPEGVNFHHHKNNEVVVH